MKPTSSSCDKLKTWNFLQLVGVRSYVGRLCPLQPPSFSLSYAGSSEPFAFSAPNFWQHCDNANDNAELQQVLKGGALSRSVQRQ